MKEPVEFMDALITLLHSWGSDTPAEATWAANELLDWVEKEFDVDFDGHFNEAYSEAADLYPEYNSKFQTKIEDTLGIEYGAPGTGYQRKETS